MLKYDTMHGRYDGTIEYDDDSITVDGKKVLFHAEMDPKNIPWGKDGVDYVVESTGVFLTKEKAQAHIDGRREEGHHVRPLQGRHPDVRHGRQPGHLHPAI